MYLAGDIGGTKTILALFSEENELRKPVVETKFPSDDYSNLEEIVQQFLAENASILDLNPVVEAAFGVAGPIIANRAKITNLEWVVDQQSLADTLDLSNKDVVLLNDLEATATAVPHLLAEDVYTLNRGNLVEHSPMAVIAPGTGLGMAYLTWDGNRYRAFPSEGGHADYGPGDHLQLHLINYLAEQYPHVSVERVCSGIGIPNIYNFLKDENLAGEPSWLREALEQVDDPVPMIMNNALNAQPAEAICIKTLEIFVSILGAEVGNLALTLLARGGVYLGGGIPPRILTALDSPLFMRYFSSKGRFTEIVSQIPVHVILNPKTALLGAAYAALQLDN